MTIDTLGGSASSVSRTLVSRVETRVRKVCDWPGKKDAFGSGGFKDDPSLFLPETMAIYCMWLSFLGYCKTKW